MKNRLIGLSFASLFHVGIMIFILFPTICIGQETTDTDLNISMTLINMKDKSSENLSPKDAEITTKKITLKKNDNIQKLLADNGIYADGESIGIIYQLNSRIDSTSIKEGVEFVFPVVKITKQLSSSSKDDYLVALTLDKNIKQDFFNTIKQLDVAVGEMSSLNLDSLISIENKDKFIMLTKSILENMKPFKVLIRERTRSLSSEMIQQLNNEADQIKSILAKIIHENYYITNTDIESIALIAKNMDTRIKSLEETKGTGEISSKWPEVLVSVKAIDINQGKEIDNLRVYYVGQGLWNDRSKYEKSFDKLTSPSEKIIPEADYYIWVGKPQDSTPLSDRKSLEVRKKAENNKIDLDLSIK